VASELRFVLAAEWVAPSLARDRLDQWLRSLSWPTGQRQDLVLALSEAVSNSVEHGYQLDASAPQSDVAVGVIEVLARVLVEANARRRVTLTVRDHGRWREPDDPARYRGYGFSIIRACADQVNIDGRATGTTVTLTSRTAPPGPTSGLGL
jgi:anti-sigma regulatory factor (Ser/Thr protein kinase)